MNTGAWVLVDEDGDGYGAFASVADAANEARLLTLMGRLTWDAAAEPNDGNPIEVEDDGDVDVAPIPVWNSPEIGATP